MQIVKDPCLWTLSRCQRKGQGENGYQKGKGKDAKGQGKKGKGEQQKGKEGEWEARTPCSRLLEKQYSSDRSHSFPGEGSVTTHTVGQRQANVTQQSSSAETKPVVRRVERMSQSYSTCEIDMVVQNPVEFELFTFTLEMTVLSHGCHGEKEKTFFEEG